MKEHTLLSFQAYTIYFEYLGYLPCTDCDSIQTHTHSHICVYKY